ncbi:MAG: threonine synthase [Bacteroidota bacterium]
MHTLTAPVSYVSTRGDSPSVTFQEALLTGLAPDGGLYLPDQLPALPSTIWTTPASFPQLAQSVFATWIPDAVAPATLAPLTADAFSFPVPVVPLTGAWTGVLVLELFHGPTLSFKDFGARMMARWMNAFLTTTDERLTILVATSGDTGSAVADGFAGQDRVEVVLLYPDGQVSAVQERQLIVERPGVRSFAVQGTFDDCQRMVKAAFAHPRLADHPLSSANSINIGRLLPQSLYYLWAYHQVDAPAFSVVVPSGNLGNVTGGVLAARAGLPIHRFVAAHNANDFFPQVLEGHDVAFTPSVRTLSNAMDVGAPSNFERLRTLFSPEALRQRFWGTSVDDARTEATMREVFEATGYVACPHTAVGLEAARRYRAATTDDAPLVVLATAHPAKFPESVRRATGQEPAAPDRLSALWSQPTRVAPLAPSPDALADVILAAA